MTEDNARDEELSRVLVAAMHCAVGMVRGVRSLTDVNTQSSQGTQGPVPLCRRLPDPETGADGKPKSPKASRQRVK